MDKMTMKAHRVNAGLTQKEAAEAIGVTIGTICRWERGQTSPPFEKVVKLAILYKCNVADFFVPINEA